MSTPFDRLAPFIREFIYRSTWDELRPIQVAAIECIFDSTDDVLIAASTASGKTEAVFLPILSQLYQQPSESVQVLYVGPLRALINDQFQRLESVCQQSDITVYRWHGDVAVSHKARLLKNPAGVLQITPESIESLLINKPEMLARLFRQLQWIVIDEVHTFLDTDRGLHLRTQLERLATIPETGRPRRVGLSATVGDLQVAQRWLNHRHPERVHIIQASGVHTQVLLNQMHIDQTVEHGGQQGLPTELLGDLYQLTCNLKSLIFCNSRSMVEVLTDQLNRRCSRDKREERYLPHHGSVSKEVREFAEARMRDHERPMSVVCTNTLELGIDIGRLDLVVQVDSTHTVMSFVQRLGRSGRREDAPRIMQVYSIDRKVDASAPFYIRFPWNMLKALAVTSLYLEGWLEPPHEQQRPYHILYHQILSRLTQLSGEQPRSLVGWFMHSGLFPEIPADEYALLLQHLAIGDHIQQMSDGTFIVGLEGERVVRSRDFYAVFHTPTEWSVLHEQRVIGKIQPTLDLHKGLTLLLAGRVWHVLDILPERLMVLVKPSHQSTNCFFPNNGVPEMHPGIAVRVRTLLESREVPSFLSPAGIIALDEARSMYVAHQLATHMLFKHGATNVIFPWTGSRAVTTLKYIFEQLGYEVDMLAAPWAITVSSPPNSTLDFQASLHSLSHQPLDIQTLVEQLDPILLQHKKFDEYLPLELLQKRAVDTLLDGATAQQIIKELAVFAAEP